MTQELLEMFQVTVPKYLGFLGVESKNTWLATVTIIINAAIIILLVPCWSLGQSQDNIQKTLTNECPRVSVGSNALIYNSLNSPSTFIYFDLKNEGKIFFIFQISSK